MNNNIVISVACYNNEDEIIEFAKQIAEQSISEQIQLIITCNSVNHYDYLKDEIEKIHIKTYIYNPEKNLGYMSGCLYGVEKTQLPESFWLMISNTDLTFTSNRFLEEILSNVEEEVWCIGPNITLKETGKNQNPFLVDRPSRRSMLLRKIAYSNLFFYKAYFKLSEIKNSINKIQNNPFSMNVYAVHGSCFLVNSKIIPTLMEESGNIFMYGEELLVSELVRSEGKSVYYNSIASIIHNENQVTGTITTKRKQQWFKQSTDYIIRRFYK